MKYIDSRMLIMHRAGQVQICLSMIKVTQVSGKGLCNALPSPFPAGSSRRYFCKFSFKNENCSLDYEMCEALHLKSTFLS